MSMPTQLSEYNDRHTDDWLGRICWFSCRQTSVPHRVVVDHLDALGLGDFAPKKPSDPDVWRKVTTAAQRHRVPTDQPGVYENVLVRDVTTGEDELLRRLVVETVDAAGKRLSYEESYDCTFHRPSATAGLKKLTPTNSAADDVAAEITLGYAQQRGTVDANGIRSTLHRALTSMQAITVRETGGVLFVSRSEAGQLSALQTFADNIPGTDFHSLPLVDEPVQRTMVQKAVTDETLTEIDRALNEMREMLSSGQPVSSRKFATINQTYKDLCARADTYADLLEDNLDSARSRLRIYDSAMAQLASQLSAAA